MFQDDDAVRAKIPRLKTEVTARIPTSDPRSFEFSEQLRAMLPPGSPPAQPHGYLDRAQLREIRQTLDDISDQEHRRVRTYRNVVLLAIVVLAIGLTVAALDPPGQPWLPVCSPGGSCQDIWKIEFVGALGGMLAGLAALSALEGISVTYALPYWMALLKVPAGALTGLLGVLWLQNGVLGGLNAQSPDAVLAYAALFGVAQEAVTGFADKRARSLLQGARGRPG